MAKEDTREASQAMVTEDRRHCGGNGEVVVLMLYVFMDVGLYMCQLNVCGCD